MSETTGSAKTIAVHNSTTGTVSFGGPRKVQPGICKEHNLIHAWEMGPTLTTYPGIPTRRCANCGQEQWMRVTEPEWQDRS